jgi:hypothetical protein
MKKILIIVVALILISCNNRTSAKKEIKEQEEQFCKILNLPDSSLQSIVSTNLVRQTNVDGRLKLSEVQRKMLFEWSPEAIDGTAYLYGVRKIHNDVYLLFVLVEDVSDEKFYMITVDCSTKKLDYVFFSEGDFFDVIDQSEDTETGLFESKYFKVLNDTTVSTISIIREERKARKDGIILTSQKDSIIHDYLINRKGELELIHSDSVRLNTIR